MPDEEDKGIEENLEFEDPLVSGEDITPSEEEGEEDPFSPEVLSSAEEYGISEEDARKFPSPEVLEKVLSSMKSPSVEIVPEEVPRVPEVPKELQVEEFDLSFSEDEFDSNLGKKFSEWNRHVHGQMKKLAGVAQSLYQALLNSEQQAVVRDIDDFVESLGPQWGAVYGKGSAGSLNHGSRAWKARIELEKQAAALGNSFLKSKGKLLPRRELLRRAHLSLHSDKLEEMTTKKVGDSLKKRSRMTVGSPSSRKSSRPVDPRKRAEQALMKKFGFDIASRLDGEEEEGPVGI